MTPPTHRLGAWIDSEARLDPSLLRMATTVWGLFAFYAVITMLQQGYDVSKNGDVFTLPLSSWFPNVPGNVHRVIVVSLVPASILLMLQRFAAMAALWIFTALVYILMSDHFAMRHAWVFLAHIYLLLACMHGGQNIMVGESDKTLGDYAVVAFKIFIALVYVFAAVAKFNSGFLSGDVLRQIVMRWPPDSLVRTIMDLPLVYPLGAISSVVIELSLPIALLIRRTRPAAIALGLVFHTLVPVFGTGPSLNFYAVTTYLFFLEPDKPLSRSYKLVAAYYVLLWFVYLLPIVPWPRHNYPPVLWVTLCLCLGAFLVHWRNRNKRLETEVAQSEPRPQPRP